MIDHVVFDIGRVLIHWDPEIPYRRHIPDDAARARFLAEICSPDWNLEQDRGRSWREAEDALIARHPDKADLVRAFRRDWRQMVPHAYEASVAIFRDLIARGIDVTLLTNFAADTFIEASELYPFFAEARGVTVSGRARLVKPDRAIFDLHAASFGLRPDRTLFIDDSEANVAGARVAGWQAVRFTDAARLAEDLARHGLAVSQPKG
ncbi:haloacid dehalogenase [Aureimonas endophytica]|uniref:Haloacid dehalogenase n=1 Tax=Aureimonas endophytica TaxID=2027858 RepID=A0A916ZUS1_9HYPH|nr:HAD family phosphatase [Aureimonas endophytica]GGE14227.1 haloacid dehalogenase [Aureimonas endophytica]